MKSNLEDLYLNIKQCILILLKNYTIWSHNLVLLLLKKRTLFSKIPAVSAHESKSGSCSSELSLQALVAAIRLRRRRLALAGVVRMKKSVERIAAVLGLKDPDALKP